jgi:glycosyltransferase involved in cell wall biosynthesis
MTLVSYIVPCFNGENYILECIESIFRQNNVDVEAIVVDDGSSDSSAALVNMFIENNNNFQIFLYMHDGHQNKGVSASRKLGLLHSKGEYVCFLDADDYLVDKQKSALQVAEFRADPSLVMVHTAVNVVGTDFNSESFKAQFRFNCRYKSYNYSSLRDSFKNNRICNSTAMVKRSALNEVFFDSLQCFQYEDWALWLLLSRVGRYKCLSVETTAYRLHANSSTSFVAKNKLRHYYSLIECKLIILGRCGYSMLALKIIMSLRQDIFDLISYYSVEGSSGRLLPKKQRGLLLIIQVLLSPWTHITRQFYKASHLLRSAKFH